MKRASSERDVVTDGRCQLTDSTVACLVTQAGPASLNIGFYRYTLFSDFPSWPFARLVTRETPSTAAVYSPVHCLTSSVPVRRPCGHTHTHTHTRTRGTLFPECDLYNPMNNPQMNVWGHGYFFVIARELENSDVVVPFAKKGGFT